MQTVLVTGGAGFLGRALLERLLDEPTFEGTVRVLDRVAPGLHHPRLEVVVGDVRDAEAVRAACAGVDGVIHAASLVDWGLVPDAELEAVNVQGTRHVLEACAAHGVGALVHVSSLDAVYDGRPVLDGDESLPYPSRYPNAYCRTKAEAEQLLLDDDDGATPRRAVLRLVGLWGERDPYHLGHVLGMARRAPMVRIGDGRSRSQHLYVGNAADACVIALHDLLGPGRATGRVYFVTDHPPENFFDFLEPVVTGCGLRMLPWSLAAPRGLVWTLGAGLEALAWATRPVVRWRPGISRFAVDFVCKDLTFRGDRLREELGWAPPFGPEEALARTLAYWRPVVAGAPAAESG